MITHINCAFNAKLTGVFHATIQQFYGSFSYLQTRLPHGGEQRIERGLKTKEKDVNVYIFG